MECRLLREMAASRHLACSLGENSSVSGIPRRATQNEGAMRTRRVAISVVTFIIFHLPHLHDLMICKSLKPQCFPRIEEGPHND